MPVNNKRCEASIKTFNPQKRALGNIMVRKDVVIAILITFCLTTTLFLAKPIESQTAGQYDPNLGVDHNGAINMTDIVAVLRARALK
jgi:hypothetical protein